MLKYDVEHGQDFKPIKIIANGKPYEERPNEVTITKNQYELFLAQQGKIEQLQKENEQLREERPIGNLICKNTVRWWAGGADMRGKEE